ncbi:glycosyltransferase family 9 protein [Granulicella paludicola]|uniref:glycosyltransferase family 9 protein n=1 Tax=Granulicella paludicola TaxID=474951 RepID=UPI0021E0FB50|nr:glycosyltransferase family 9 protein [Granulicella paludicola]
MEIGTKPRRVLIYRLGSLGDMVVALPSLHLIARAFPDADRRLLTNLPVHSKAPAAEAVLGGIGLIGGYFGYPAGTRSWFELAKLVWSIRRWKPEVVIYLGPARGLETVERDAKFFDWCGVKQIIGLPSTEATQRNFYGADTDAECVDNWEPEAERLARCIRELGDARVDNISSWDLHLDDKENAEARRQIGAEALEKRPLAVCVGTKVQAKDWGVENWRTLVGRIADEYPRRTLLLVGAPEESAASEFAATAWRLNGGGPVVNLCGRLSPRQSAAALQLAQIFVGHDSGPMHLAAAVGTPCVALFAARNIPGQWFPMGAQHRVIYHKVECAGCGLETCVDEGKRCLLSITVDEVMDQVRVALEMVAPKH